MSEQLTPSPAEIFEAAGVRGFLHAVDIDTGAEIGVDADDLVVSASVFKVPVLVELCCRAARGELALTDRVVIPATGRTRGDTGLSAMADDAELSLRDLAYLMMSVSDNHATDVLIDLLGLDRIARTLGELDLHRTTVRLRCKDIVETIEEDLGLADYDWRRSMDPRTAELLSSCRAVTPHLTNHTTPRESTALLSAVWRAEGLPEQACAEVRRILALQVWPHRLTAGFPMDDVRISGKTGTLPYVRNEVGVVEYPDGGRYAVAVFLRLPGHEYRNPAADACIGNAARSAVHHLRAEQDR